MKNLLQGYLLTKARRALLLVMPAAALADQAFAAARADKQVTGRVTTEDGEALPGVNVTLKGTSVGTSTDTKGDFSLNVPSESSVLVFSFIGYGKQEVTVGSQTRIEVKMAAENQALEEMVVIGYGSQKKSSLTGAVSSVSPKELTALPVVSTEQALQGRIPGVRVLNNGSPGQTPIVRIRGIGSINYASGPLYVIDGIPSGELVAPTAGPGLGLRWRYRWPGSNTRAARPARLGPRRGSPWCG